MVVSPSGVNERPFNSTDFLSFGPSELLRFFVDTVSQHHILAISD